MLVEIECSLFRNKIVNFNEGLNVVLGDNNSSNSIGKSTLLMIIDYVFGGDSYLIHNKDVVEELGEHEIYFSFKFDKLYKFKRITDDTENIYVYEENHFTKTISKTEYTKFLKEKYDLNHISETFRMIQSPYFRVWGKGNDDIEKPLKLYKDDGEVKNAIQRLIKLFNKYDTLETLNKELKTHGAKSQTITKMYNAEYVPKIKITKYKENKINIDKIKTEIEEIKKHILKYVINSDEIINKEVLELKKEKSKLLDLKNKYNNQLLRVERNLENNNTIHRKHLKKLEEFFPQVNLKKIEKIENFHTKIKKILKAEIKNKKEDILSNILFTEEEINQIDMNILTIIPEKDNPEKIVDKIYDLTIELKKLEEDNYFHDEKKSLLSDIREKESSLSEKQKNIIKEIQNSINEKLEEINTQIYNDKRISPKFEIDEKNYNLSTPKDTGTGKGYTNLIMFDLSLIDLTKLPMIIHDSYLFKNIEDFAMENLIKLYSGYSKQIFIAIDGIQKYNKKTINLLEDRAIAKFDKRNVLFMKKWNIQS